MGAFRQVVSVTLLNLRTIPRRLGSSVVAVVGIAGVVVVLVTVLSIAEGFRAVMIGAGSPSRVVILRSGADNEMSSGLDGTSTEIIREAPGLARDGQTVLASPELFVVIDVPKRTTNTPANVPMRGIDPVTFRVRDDATIIEGRMFQFGTNEVVVGRSAARQFSGLTPGSTIHSGTQTWQVVGIFEDDGGVAETEIWCDARVLQGAYRRGNSYQSVIARLESPAAFDRTKDWLTANPQLKVSIRRESDYYAAQSTTLRTIIRQLGFGIAALMAIGAVFGAILTMYTSVATRAREIATLRALGFNAAAVLVSVVAESLCLAALGGAAGGLVAYAGFSGYQTSTINFQTFSQVAFAFTVTPGLLALGLAWALLMGLVGGLPPAVRAARLPIAQALRQL
jgi:putative ABC transport system permease protein